MTVRSLAQRLIGILPMLALCVATQARAVEENELKAAIIFNILLFVEWPDAVLPEAGGTLSLCMAANNRLSAALKALNHRAVRDLTLEVRELPPEGAAQPCHALFVEAADRVTLAAALRAQRAAGALVVSDDPDSPPDTTAIVLERVGSKLAFDVNLQPVRAAGLQLSSKLLRLARVVRQ
jgi:hypothetical protein